MKINTVALKPYSLTELSGLYQVCTRTLKKWIQPFDKEIGKKLGRYYTIVQVKIIFEKLGLPGCIAKE